MKLRLGRPFLASSFCSAHLPCGERSDLAGVVCICEEACRLGWLQKEADQKGLSQSWKQDRVMQAMPQAL